MSEVVPANGPSPALVRPAGCFSWLPTAWWAAAIVCAVAVATGYAYYSIFSLFQGYDDEGYILISLKSFFQGKPLYDQVYSSFQPGFYVLHRVLFYFWGAPVCHDNIRLLTLIFWLGGAALNGLITYRLTSSALLTLLVSVVSVRCMQPYANEPGHPEALGYLLVAALVALCTCRGSVPRRPLGLAVGGLAGLLLLIKVNVGIFACLPLALMFAAGWKCKLARATQMGLGAIIMGLPVALFRAQLAAQGVPRWQLGALVLVGLILMGARCLNRSAQLPVWVLALIAGSVTVMEVDSLSVAALPVFSAGLLSLSICAAVLAFHARSADERFEGIGWGPELTGFCVVVGAILAVVLFQGTTFHGLADGFFWWPAKVSTSFQIRLRSNWLGLCLGLVGAAGSFVYLHFSGQPARRAWLQKWIAGGQLIFGIAVLAEFYLRVPGSSTLMPVQINLPHFWMLPFAWLVAVPITDDEPHAWARSVLLVFAVLQPLIACPVAGTQLVPASLLLPVLAATCLARGLRAICSPLPAVAKTRAWRWAAGALGTLLLLAPFARETIQMRKVYLSRTPLELFGAARIRLTPEEVQAYHQVVAELAPPEVQTFLTLPGMDSFYLWTHKEPPNGLNVSAWVVLLDAQAQERIWQAAVRHPGLMVVRNRSLIRRWVRGRSVEGLPLVRHIEENFKTVAEHGGYELMTRR